ncbi:hypothetical protein [Algoriphagus sp. A40]|uniref:hypothetical protein n=1 Tax=Algoriphagus sp. A40 TaxID=1945863 RepID=UPI0011157EB5|nr:hypothetical protein [Algoriphagus sp. A40]
MKTVRDFSETSHVSIQNFEQIDYTFLDHCLDRCEDEAIGKYEFNRVLECPCELYVEADSVTQIMYQAIGGYFEGLGNLSQNELTTYSTDAVVNSMTAQELGPLAIDANMAKAYSTLSNILLRSATDFYRRRKIAGYITEANEPLQVLLSAFQGIIRTNLKGELRFKKERMYTYYMDMKMNNTLQSDYEKGKATGDYYRVLEEIQTKEKQMDLFAEALNAIAKGHQVLYDGRDKLSDKDLTKAINGNSAQVKRLLSEFNKLNP